MSNQDQQVESVESHFFKDDIAFARDNLNAYFKEPKSDAAKFSNFGLEIIAPDESIKQSDLKMEYRTLREELLKRIELRQNIIQINLTLASLILSYGLIQRIQDPITGQIAATPVVALVYPPIAALLGLGWAQIENRIQVLSTYIRLRIEKNIPSLYWETYMDELRKESRRKEGSHSVNNKNKYGLPVVNKLGNLGSSVIFSHGGVFIGTQIMALCIGFPWNPILITTRIFASVINFLTNSTCVINSFNINDSISALSNDTNDIFLALLVCFDIISIIFIYIKIKKLHENQKELGEERKLDTSVPLIAP
jgi:hypothetical protein